MLGLTCCRVRTMGSWIIHRDVAGTMREFILGMLVLGNQSSRRSRWCGKGIQTAKDVLLVLTPDEGPSWHKPRERGRYLAGLTRKSSVGCVCWDTKVDVDVDSAVAEMRLETTFDLLSTPDDDYPAADQGNLYWDPVPRFWFIVDFRRLTKKRRRWLHPERFFYAVRYKTPKREAELWW